MPYVYSNNADSDNPHKLPNVEVFYLNEAEAQEMFGEDGEEGWYWWACFPGCLPDGEPSGPFPTEYDAECDAEEEQDSCAECARQHGPHYTGRCAH